MKTLKLGKAAEEDGITTELLINLPEEITKELCELIKEIWESRRLPEDWRTAITFLIHKNGDENAVGNCRGISLLDVGYKILATVMTKRLGDWLKEKEILAEAQAGFRSKRGTMEQVFVLNAVIGNRLKQRENKLYTAFIDFKKVFDHVSRVRLWRKMENIGIKGKFLEMTKEIYKITWNGVLVGEKVTEKFETNNGVRQGCPLSPILFNIFIYNLEETLRKNNTGGTALGSSSGTGLKVYALLYAVDVALVAEDGRELTSMLKTLERWSHRNQMEVNVEKTKIMVFRNGGRRKSERWRYKGENIEVVREFKYLGFWFTTKSQYSVNIKKAAGKHNNW